MTRIFYLTFLFFFLACASLSAASSAGNTTLPANGVLGIQSEDKVFVVPVEGVFRPFLDTLVRNKTQKAIDEGAGVIIYRIDSGGGQLGSAFEMSNYVFTLPSRIKTIAYVDSKAYSAAALFSLACDKIVMTSAAAIGDCEPIVQSSGGYETMGDKVQSPLRERFRTYAENNGYPPLLAQAMVTKEWKVLKVQEGNTYTNMRQRDFDHLPETRKSSAITTVLNHSGELLTINARQALEYGFSSANHESVEAMLIAEGHSGNFTELPPNATERFLMVFEGIAGLFLAGAFFFGYLEVKTPGVGVFLSLSAICLCGFMLPFFYSGQANYLEVMLIVLGLALLFVEVLVIPGFGLAGIAGIVILLAGLVLSMQNFDLPRHDSDYSIITENLATISGAFIGATLLFAVCLSVLPRFGFSFLPGLISTTRQEPTPTSDQEASGKRNLEGKTGVTMTDLHPAGKAEIEGKPVQVIARDGWISAGETVKVVKDEGFRVVVTQSKSNYPEGSGPEV